MRKAAPASSNLNNGYRAIGEAVIILTRSLKQFRLDKVEVCCGPQKLVCAMMLQGCRKADRAEVVEIQTPIVIQRFVKDKAGRQTHRFSLTCPECGNRLPRYRALTLGQADSVIAKSG